MVIHSTAGDHVVVPALSLLPWYRSISILENQTGSKGEAKEYMKSKSEIRSNGTVGKRLLNVRETAEYMGLEVDTVYKKARLRKFPSVKVGGALRFDINELDRLIEQNAKSIL